MAGHSPPTSATATEPVSWTSMAVATFCSGFRSDEQQLQEHGQQHRQDEPDGDPDPAKVAGAAARPGAAAAEGVGDHVDVDVPGIADHPGADPAAEKTAEQAGELLVPGDADDDLGGVDAAGEVQQGGGRVLSGHDVVAAAQVQDQPALGFERLGRLRGDAVGGADVDGQQVPAADAVQDAGPAADEDFPFGAAGQPDDDAFPGRPAVLDALFGPVLGQALRPPGRPATAGRVRAVRVRLPSRK